MKRLLKKRKYNSGKRPSQHKIGKESFLNDRGGSIMPNVIELEPTSEGRSPRLPQNLLRYSNTSSNDPFTKICREKGIVLHPARMPRQLPMLFIEFLTDVGDLVVDPFAGSNTTGVTAELLGRKWLSIDLEKDYADQAKLRLHIEKKEYDNGNR
jgi:site-specific DNA-methyltransferase (cytosine-N4-specific)